MTIKTILMLAPLLMGEPVNFTEALDRTLRWEGGGMVHEVEGDAGGVTKWGIAQRYHPDVDVRTLTFDEAAAIYRGQYWTAVVADDLPAEYRWDVFDMAVNAGPQNAAWLLQQALNLCRRTSGQWLVVVDGQIGPQTLRAADMTPPSRVTVTYRALRAQYYLDRVEREPAKVKFLVGWLRRAADGGRGCV